MSTATTTHASEPGALRWYRWLVWAGIAANVVAAFHHDHVFVPEARAADAMACLARFS